MSTTETGDWTERWQAAVKAAEADPVEENFRTLNALRHERILALEDDDPARKMMRGFVRAAGREGISVPDLKDSLEFTGHGHAIPAVSNWLRQDAGVKLLECVPSGPGQAPGPKWRVKQAEPPLPEGSHARERMLELLEARGATGATLSALQAALRGEGYPVPARDTIRRWMRTAVEDGRAHQAEPALSGRYVAGPAATVMP